MLTTGSDAIAVVDGDQRLQGAVTRQSVLAWVAAGAGTADQPITGLLRGAPPAVGSAASVIDGVLAIAEADADALAVTSDGSSSGQLQALVTSRDIARVFGDQPDLDPAGDSARGEYAGTARAQSPRARIRPSVPHERRLARLAGTLRLADRREDREADHRACGRRCVVRVLVLLWSVGTERIAHQTCAAAGRSSSKTRVSGRCCSSGYERVSDALTECDYLARVDLTFDRAFLVASKAEWQTRYEQWLRDPVRAQMYLARPLFDLRPVHGRESLWHDVEATVAGAVDRDLLHVLANDCLASLPPLTFFQDAVVDESGEHTTVFRLEHSALRPLVDVGRVFGMAARQVARHLHARALRVCPNAAARARVDLPRRVRDAAHPALAAGAHRDRPGHQRIGVAAGAAQPPRPARLEERLPLDPATARVHRQLALVRRVMTEPSFVDRYRRCFDTTWTDETPIDQVRFVVLDSETTGLNPRTDRIITIGAVAVSRSRDRAGGLLRRAADSR